MSWLDENTVYTTKEAIKYLKISKPTFLKFVHSGKIRAVKVGNRWRVPQSELFRLLNPEGKLRDGEIHNQDLKEKTNGKKKQI
jgi:excisionase family DNA binding protein